MIQLRRYCLHRTDKRMKKDEKSKAAQDCY